MPGPVEAGLIAHEAEAGADIAKGIASMRKNPSVALPRRVAVHEAAEASRRAVSSFLTMEPDELSLSAWLAGPYREATSFGPRRTPSQRPHDPPGSRPPPETDIPDLVTTAKNRVISALGAAQRGVDALLEHLPPIVHVEPAHDAYGNRGFVAAGDANMSLVDRVLALVVVDYLTRPHDYVPSRHPFSSAGSGLHVAAREGRDSALAAGVRR